MPNWRDALDQGALIIAHRGARSLAPENTLPALAAAARAGAQGCEVDVRLSKDGRVILHHDPNLTRTCNARELYPGQKPWPAANFTLQEIQALDFGSWFERKDPFGAIAMEEVAPEHLLSFQGISAPTLEQALALCAEQGLLINVEIKDLGKGHNGPDPALAVARLVLDMDMTPQVLISSFNHDYLRTLARKEPQLNLGALVKKRHPDPLGLTAELGALCFHPHRDSIPLMDVQNLSRQGLAILPWTVNQADIARAFLSAGAKGIITDFPQRKNQYLP